MEGLDGDGLDEKRVVLALLQRGQDSGSPFSPLLGLLEEALQSQVALQMSMGWRTLQLRLGQRWCAAQHWNFL